jgi:hypothetical protein
VVVVVVVGGGGAHWGCAVLVVVRICPPWYIPSHLPPILAPSHLPPILAPSLRPVQSPFSKLRPRSRSMYIGSGGSVGGGAEGEASTPGRAPSGVLFPPAPLTGLGTASPATSMGTPSTSRVQRSCSVHAARVACVFVWQWVFVCPHVSPCSGLTALRT